MADGKEFSENLGQARQDINAMAEELSVLRNIFAELKDILKSQSKDAGEIASATREASREAGAQADIARRMQTFAAKDLKDKRTANSVLRAYQQQQELVLKQTQEIAYLEEYKKGLGKAEQDQVDALIQKRQDLLLTGEKQLENLEKQAQAVERIQEAGSRYGNLADIVSKIPIVGGILANSFRKSERELEEISEKFDGIDETARQFNVILKSIGNAALVTLAAGFFKVDNSTTEIAKQLAISKDEARALSNTFNAIAIDSGTAALNSSNLAQAFIQLGNTTGAVAGFTGEQVEQQARLTELVGLQGEEAAKLNQFGILNNEGTKNQNIAILEQVALLEKNTGLQLDGRKILSQVAQINGQLGAQYGYNTQELTRAVIQANRLGLSLEDTQGIAANLLDFESSIVNELQAELLTNKNLNFERARLLAINGKSSEAVAEMNEQLGSAEEFSRLNVLQQESLAKAVGMTTDQLADSLKQQEILNTLGEKNFENLLKTEEGRKRLRTLGGEEIYQNIQLQSSQQKIASFVEKLTISFGNLVDGPLGTVVDYLAKAADSSGLIVGGMTLLGTLSLGRLIATIAGLALQSQIFASGAVLGVSALTLGIGAIAIGAMVASLMATAKKAREEALPTVDDMIIPTGYGDRIISTPKGSVALNNNDTVVAGTNLGQGSQETKRTNMLLEKLITQNASKPQLSPVGLYEVQ
ncbi:hypothetical protein PQZ39_01120 [bacterium]|nr:hypothetical protein [bacterium]